MENEMHPIGDSLMIKNLLLVLLFAISLSLSVRYDCF